jgi:NAD(P)H-nitrite reductase large subunit
VAVDENAQAGGQYYRQPDLPGARPDARQRRGRVEIERASAVAELRLGCSAFGLDGAGGGLRLWLDDGGVVTPVEPRAIVLATGAFDTPVAFPGWTLPGVVSAGAAQALIKSQRIRPGRRAVVAGSGPFLLVVANALRQAGVRVVEVVEAASVRDSVPFLPASLRHARRYAELSRLVLPLAGSGVPIRLGNVVVEAEGDEHLEAVRLRQRTAHGRRREVPRERIIEADLLCVGYGFSASTELARLAGAALTHDRGLRQSVPVYDEWQATTRSGVFVAGEACGLGGAEVAAAEGELAAIGAVRYLGRLSEEDATDAAAAARRRLGTLRDFASLLARLFPEPSELAMLADDETIVCRCEGVALHQVLAAIDESGARSLNEIKTITRCGQGWCQGRICGALLPRAIGARRRSFDGDALFTARNPLRPITLGAIADQRDRDAAAGRDVGDGPTRAGAA